MDEATFAAGLSMLLVAALLIAAWQVGEDMKQEELTMVKFQKVKQKEPLNRADHIWYSVVSNDKTRAGWWKCVLCGSMTLKPPPGYPTPDDWLASRFEIVTAEERAMCPYEGSKV